MASRLVSCVWLSVKGSHSWSRPGCLSQLTSCASTFWGCPLGETDDELSKRISLVYTGKLRAQQSL